MVGRWRECWLSTTIPRARALYERLGYSEAWATLDSWPVAGGRTYVTACTIMERRLIEVPSDEVASD